MLQGVILASLAGGGDLPAAAAQGSRGSFDRRRWWTGDYRIVQTNLREVDIQENPREIAMAVKDFGGNVIVSNIGGIVSFYATNLELQYQNPSLKSDFVKEMIEAA